MDCLNRVQFAEGISTSSRKGKKKFPSVFLLAY